MSSVFSPFIRIPCKYTAFFDTFDVVVDDDDDDDDDDDGGIDVCCFIAANCAPIAMINHLY